jgi:hypothetical protein
MRQQSADDWLGCRVWPFEQYIHPMQVHSTPIVNAIEREWRYVGEGELSAKSQWGLDSSHEDVSDASAGGRISQPIGLAGGVLSHFEHAPSSKAPLSILPY